MIRAKDGQFDAGREDAGMRACGRNRINTRRLYTGVASCLVVMVFAGVAIGQSGAASGDAFITTNRPISLNGLNENTFVAEPVVLALGPSVWADSVGYVGVSPYGVVAARKQGSGDSADKAELREKASAPAAPVGVQASVANEQAEFKSAAVAQTQPESPAASAPTEDEKPVSKALSESSAKTPDRAATQSAARREIVIPDEDPFGMSNVKRDKDSLVASITLGGEQAEQIIISKNATATIDFRVPVDRVQITSEDVANYEVISETRINITGKEFGSTQLLLWAGDQRRAFNILVELDLSLLESYIKSVEPMSSVVPLSINGRVVLTGTVPDAQAAERVAQLATLLQGGDITNQLRVAGVQQAMLRVVVAEVNRDALRQLGINWAIGASDWSRDFFFANNVGNIAPTTFGSSGVTDVLTGQQLYSAAPNAAATNITFGFPRAEFQVFMNALRQNDLARTLAEPNLVAISGQTATFLAGGEVPIPVRQGTTTTGITIEYKEFGVRLGFTPTVMAGQLMRLHVMTEISEAIPGIQVAGGLPTYTFTTRRVESTIECGNGQTFAIAGLLNEEVRATASKIPGLGDLPVLGTLFSSTEYRQSNSEMVVLVTPELVEPLDPQQVPPAPGTLITHPTDYQLFALQKLEGPKRETIPHQGVPRERFPVNTRPGDATSWPTTSQLALQGPWGLADFGEY